MKLKIKQQFWLGMAAILTCFLIPTVSHSADIPNITNSAWVQAIMGLMGGVAFLLFGLDHMSSSLKALAGENLRIVLTKLTINRVSSLFTGIGVTMLVQSSAATIVMVLGFISTGFMSLTRAMGVILGADIGTTITVQLIAFRLNKYALFAVAFGFFLNLIARKEKAKELGMTILSIGLVFYGIQLIGDSMNLVKDSPLLFDLIAHMDNSYLAIIVGVVLTALMQSSAATLGIIIAFASQGLINLDMALALTIGANVGTCFTALIASMGKPRMALRAALAHTSFKVTGALLALPFFSLIIDLVQEHWWYLQAPRQIANLHSLFNIILAFIFLPLIYQIALLLKRVIPEKVDLHEALHPKYLDADLINTPTLAIEVAQLEIGRMAGKVGRMMERAKPVILQGSKIDLRMIQRKEKDIDALYAPIMKYLGEISKQNLSEEQVQHLLSLMQTVNNLETVGDLIGIGLVNMGKKRINKNIVVSTQTKKMLMKLFDQTEDALDNTIQALRERDKDKANKTIKMKAAIRRTVNDAHTHQATRLIADEENRINTYSLEVDVIDKLQRIYYHSRKVAAAVQGWIMLEEERNEKDNDE